MPCAKPPCDPDSPFCHWARETIAEAVAGDGAAINAVSLAEICVGDADLPPSEYAVGASKSLMCPRPMCVPRHTAGIGSGGCLSPMYRFLSCRS